MNDTKRSVTASYDDHGVVLLIQARPDGPIGPIRLSLDEVLGLSVGLATAVDAYQAHLQLVDANRNPRQRLKRLSY